MQAHKQNMSENIPLDGLAERLRQVRKHYDLTQIGMAQAMQVAPSSVNRQLQGTSHPSVQSLQALLQSFPDLNADWLLTGKGSMTGKSAEAKPSVIAEMQKQIADLQTTLRTLLAYMPNAKQANLETLLGKTLRNLTQRPGFDYTIIDPESGLDATIMVFPGSVRAMA